MKNHIMIRAPHPRVKSVPIIVLRKGFLDGRATALGKAKMKDCLFHDEFEWNGMKTL